MLACFQGRDRRLFVQVGRQADIDQVDLRVVQHVFQAGVGVHLRDIDLLARGAKVPFDSPPIPFLLLRVPRSKRSDVHAADLLIGQVMNPAHKADAYDSDIDHGVFLKVGSAVRTRWQGVG